MTTRAIQMAEFELLKQRLLLRELNDLGSWEAHTQIIQEAEKASEIAGRTAFPSFLFPSLFEERVNAAMEAFHDREASYWEAFR